jgi:hypothetical protein
MPAITLDVSYDPNEDFPKFMHDIEQQYDIEAIVVKWAGSGGGWPEIKFVGEKPNLAKFIRERYQSGDAEEDEYLITLIEE